MDAEGLIRLDKENNIYIELGAVLNVEIDGSGGGTVKNIFVGNKSNKYIVITSPSQQKSGRDDIFKKNMLNIKYLFQRQVFEFQTRFLKSISEPVPLTLLDYPKSVRPCDLRSQKRVNCFISAIIEFEADKDSGKTTGVIKNISKSGCRFLIPSSKNAENMFHINEQIVLKCHFPGIVGVQEAFGKVRDIQKDDAEISIRIQFSDALWWIPPYG